MTIETIEISESEQLIIEGRMLCPAKCGVSFDRFDVPGRNKHLREKHPFFVIDFMRRCGLFAESSAFAQGKEV